jgi:hypothetical protein
MFRFRSSGGVAVAEMLLPIVPPLRVLRTPAGYQIRDAAGRSINLYSEDDAFRRSALPPYWRGEDARALACWLARALTDAVERGEVTTVNSLMLPR